MKWHEMPYMFDKESGREREMRKNQRQKVEEAVGKLSLAEGSILLKPFEIRTFRASYE